MSVTNYIPDSCKYSIGKLMKSVYLISEDAVKGIRIDNGDAYINSVSETPMRLDCYSINLSEEESLDERYKFIHTLKFSVNGYANKDDFQGRYYVIVKDEEGTYWFVNPLFPVKVTYTYTLGYQQNHTDFSIATASNHPVLRLYGMSDTDPYQCDGYFLDGIDALWLNEKKYTVHNGNSVKYTNGGFKVIEYNKSSAVFTETFDGENTKHQIDFDVLFSQYKSSWHYNLLEFKDNLYSAVIRTSNGKYALCGFSLGLQPSYTVSADDTIQNADKIQITLQDAHDAGDPIEFFDSIDYEYLPYKSYEYTSEYDGYECVGEGIARYLLQKEVDALGNETGNYKALEGYTGRFPGLNIVGTFSNTETFTSVECNGSDCTIDTSFPSTLTFNNKECQTYYLKADSSWSMSSSANYITVSPSSGDAGVGYYVNVCNTLTPGAEVQTSTLSIQYCSTSTTVNVNVVQNNGCFPQGAVYNISANAQVLNVPTACCVQSVRETTNVGSSTIIYNSYLAVTVPENNTGRYRTITLLIVFCDGTSANVTINQSNVFEKWISEGFECINYDKYRVQRLYTGTTSSSITARTETVDYVLIETQSIECNSSDKWGYEKWEAITGDYFCDNGTKYARERRYVSNDGVTWTATNTYRKSDVVIELNSTDCGYDPSISGNCIEYRDEGDSICNGYHKYKYLRKYVRDCQNCNNCSSQWIRTNIYSIDDGQVIEYYSSDCGFVCVGCTNAWVTSGYTCVGYDKYRVDVMHITHADGSVWITPTTSTTLVEQSSDYCGCSNPQYMWNKAPVSDYVCDMETHTKYYKEYYQVSCDGINWENVIPESSRTSTDIIETGSTDCGYVPPIPYDERYFTIVPETNGEIKFNGRTAGGPKKTYYYSMDSGITWTAGETWETGIYDLSGTTILMTAGIPIWVKADMVSGNTILGDIDVVADPYSERCNVKYHVEGNIMSLVYGDDFIGKTSLNIENLEYTFDHFFCPTEYHPSDSLTSAENLILPATTLNKGCYYGMFKYCGLITKSPVLPATDLVDSCYGEMFHYCTNLREIRCFAQNGINTRYSTIGWVLEVAANGKFYKKSGVTWPSGENGIPGSWTIVDII